MKIYRLLATSLVVALNMGISSCGGDIKIKIIKKGIHTSLQMNQSEGNMERVLILKQRADIKTRMEILGIGIIFLLHARMNL